MADSIDDQFQDANNERRWRLSYLKNQFDTLDLHQLFDRYRARISHGYFSQYLTLQIILIVAHLVIICTTIDRDKIVPDIALYSIILVCSVVILIVTDTRVKQSPQLLKPLAIVAFSMVFFANFFIPLYNQHENLRPAYTTYLIISNYIFLYGHSNITAMVVGSLISIVHLSVLILVTYEDQDKLYARIVADAIYLGCINALGVYFRYMNEIVIRRSFLDKRSCVASTNQLKFEDEQSDQLMSSIIPKHIIDKFKEQMMAELKQDGHSKSINRFLNPLIESHENVTILFADIVNYSKMTTIFTNQRPVVDLLEILNELFGRFDDASKVLKVLRIKFLGDCYYCVAGLPPDPAPNPAEACVDLGLKMIEIIKDIGQKEDLDINMRIGIHTGNISSGIIGVLKWQFDIWSNDVDTANKMETEGEPGKIHITEQTMKLLKKPYNMVATKKVVSGNKTFLISPTPSKMSTTKSTNTPDLLDSPQPQPRPSIYQKRHSNLQFADGRISAKSTTSDVLNNNSTSTESGEDTSTMNNNTWSRSQLAKTSLTKRISNSNVSRASMDRKLTPMDISRRTAFMNYNIKRYKERLQETNASLGKTIENMRLSKYEQWFKDKDVYRLLLAFKDAKTEWKFISLADPLFKYYLLTALMLSLIVYVIENLTQSKWDAPNWPFYTSVALSLFFFLPLSWTQHVWSKYIVGCEVPPKNVIVRFYYDASKFISDNVWVRTAIYTVVYGLFFVCVLLEWVECPEITLFPREKSDRKWAFFELAWIRNSRIEATEDNCMVPWHMTDTCAMAIITSFLFIRTYVWLKLFYATIVTVVYSLCIFQFNIEFYGDSQTFNSTLNPKISHAMNVVFLTLTLHMVDRQTEYMNRLDYLWYEMLIEKKKRANSLHQVNKVLLRNILPAFVAEIYLNLNRQESLYHENYPQVAVMFATITDLNVEDMGEMFLKTMNSIISAFDVLSRDDQFGRPIEKIKVAKWTYMAACGVAPGVGSVDNYRRDQSNHAVIALLKFSAGLMSVLKRQQFGLNQKMQLRIGLCYGPIAAGVVGSRKPFYDIWGDAVNMASRMDSTGVPGKIQVFGETAAIIREFGYALRYRGPVDVKGRDRPLHTYFVELDERYELVRASQTISEEDSDNS